MTTTATTAPKPLTAKQVEILAAAREAAGTVEQDNGDVLFVAGDIARHLDVKTNTITGVLTSLVKRGELARVARSGVYVLPAPPVTVVDPADTVSIPEDALTIARELINAEAAFQTTKAGSHGKVVTVGDAYVTTDGHHLTAKTGGDPKLPWILVEVQSMKLVGTYKSSSQALTLEVLGHTA